ncbi:MAG TPA: Yip1 family protein [Xanthobacteraceae bacterium]|jgi:hypothetical protein|nr:Yip1 family protein [Xanthobacteraceae bacterium]
MNAARRAMAMLFDPAVEWAKIESESGDPALVLSRYAAWLAIVPALSGFIGASVIGATTPTGVIVRASLFDGVAGAIFGYVMSLAAVLVVALVIDLMAPLFGGRRDFDSAFKLAVYSFTPVWLAGVFLLLPGLHFLMLTGFYGAYLAWLGLAQLIKLNPRRMLDFTALIVIAAFALLYITAALQRAVFGTAGL